MRDLLNRGVECGRNPCLPLAIFNNNAVGFTHYLLMRRLCIDIAITLHGNAGLGDACQACVCEHETGREGTGQCFKVVHVKTPFGYNPNVLILTPAHIGVDILCDTPWR